MTRGQAIWLAFLVVAIVSTAVSVVYAKSLSRSLFVELQHEREQRDQADMEWGRLQLELATSGSLGRVMHLATERMQMRAPSAESIVVVD